MKKLTKKQKAIYRIHGYPISEEEKDDKQLSLGDEEIEKY